MLAKRCRTLFSQALALAGREVEHRTASSGIVRSPLPDRQVPNETYHDAIWSNADKWANSEALVCGETGTSVTFEELKSQSEKFRSVLLSRLGMSPGDVLGVVLPNCLEYPPIIMGSLEANLILSTMNPLYTSREIAHQMKSTGARVIVTTPEKLSEVQQAVSSLNLKNSRIVLTGPSSALPLQNSSILSYDKLLQDTGTCSNETKGQLDDTVYIPFSSGTTGLPKGVCLSNRNLLSSMLVFSTSHHFRETTSTYQPVVPIVLPLFHAYAFSVMAFAIHAGAKIIVLPKLQEKTLIRALRDHKASVLYVAPPLVQYMIVNQSIGDGEMASLETVLCGAAPLADSDAVRLIKKSGKSLQVRQLYGMTESSPLIVDGLVNSPDKLGSVGRPGINVQMKITQVGGSSEPLGRGESGEICIRGPQIMKGYLNNQKATNDVIDGEGWFHSGDIGHFDDDDCLFVTDRVKELIKVKGFQVAPAEIEAVLRTHPDVLDVGVVGAPHSTTGETPVAFVVVKESARWNTSDISDFLAQRMAPFKIPSKFVKLSEVPKSQSGKILRRELIALLDKKL